MALELGGNLQYGSKIRFKLKKKKKRKAEWYRGTWGLGSTEQGRQANALFSNAPARMYTEYLFLGLLLVQTSGDPRKKRVVI